MLNSDRSRHCVYECRHRRVDGGDRTFIKSEAPLLLDYCHKRKGTGATGGDGPAASPRDRARLVVGSHIDPTGFPFKFVFDLLGYLGVGVFFFMSGYLLQLGYPSIETSSDARHFFNRRAWRIFPLYWVAFLVALLVGNMDKKTGGGIISTGDVLAHLIGLQIVLFPSYISILALWFVGAIVVCYLLYPLLVYRSPSIGWLLLRALATFLLIGVAWVVLGLFAVERIIFFPFFVLGVVAGMTNFLKSDHYRSWRLGLAVAAVPMIG